MIAKIVTENGVKKLVPLASGAQIGSGLPLGTVIPVYSNVCPSDYLPCNGVAFDENQYPALYQLLGDNHTPDLRECALVGIGESDRPSSELVTHDVYTLGQFKDDQVQDHTHASTGANGNFPQVGSIVGQGAYSSVTNSNFTTGSITYGRVGTTTHGKQIGVNYVIKATSGLETGQQEYVLQALNEAGSYSTEEVATGKKWIDGKTIYRRYYLCTTTISFSNWTDVTNAFANLSSDVPIMDTLVKATLNVNKNQIWGATGFVKGYPSQNSFSIYALVIGQASANDTFLVLEYTKTTN